MSFAHAPSALVTQPFVHPVPQTVDGLLNAGDMTGAEGGCGGGEGVGDMATEMSVGVRPREATSGLPQLKAIVRELLSEVGQLPSTTSDLGACGPVSNYFGAKGVVAFLLHSPVYTVGVDLSVSEEELLSPIERWARDVVRASMERAGVDR